MLRVILPSQCSVAIFPKPMDVVVQFVLKLTEPSSRLCILVHPPADISQYTDIFLPVP